MFSRITNCTRYRTQWHSDMQRAVKKISQLAVIKTVTWSWRTGTQPTSLTLCAPVIFNGCYWSLTSVPELVLDSFVHALPFRILSIKSFSFRGIKDDGYTGSNKLIWDTPTLYSQGWPRTDVGWPCQSSIALELEWVYIYIIQAHTLNSPNAWNYTRLWNVKKEVWIWCSLV